MLCVKANALTTITCECETTDDSYYIQYKSTCYGTLSFFKPLKVYSLPKKRQGDPLFVLVPVLLLCVRKSKATFFATDLLTSFETSLAMSFAMSMPASFARFLHSTRDNASSASKTRIFIFPSETLLQKRIFLI